MGQSGKRCWQTSTTGPLHCIDHDQIYTAKVWKHVQVIPIQFGRNILFNLLNLALRFGGTAVAPPPIEPPAPEPVLEAWKNDATTIQQIMDNYIIEAKIPGRHPGTTLFIVHAEDRAGKFSDFLDGQKYKLFIAPSLETLGVAEVCVSLSHG